MSVAAAVYDVDQRAEVPISETGPAPKRIVVAYGFWIFLLSDIVMFSALFAAYAVLVNATAGGPTGAELFNQVSVALETAFLLLSSYTCGLMFVAVGAELERRAHRLHCDEPFRSRSRASDGPRSDDRRDRNRSTATSCGPPGSRGSFHKTCERRQGRRLEKQCETVSVARWSPSSIIRPTIWPAGPSARTAKPCAKPAFSTASSCRARKPRPW